MGCAVSVATKEPDEPAPVKAVREEPADQDVPATPRSPTSPVWCSRTDSAHVSLDNRTVQSEYDLGQVLGSCPFGTRPAFTSQLTSVATHIHVRLHAESAATKAASRFLPRLLPL